MFQLTNNVRRITIPSFKLNKSLYLVKTKNRNKFRFLSSMCENKKPNAPSKEAEIKPFPENDDAVWVGPPHPVSQLRLKVFPDSKNLTKEEKDFYVQCKETQEWNHNYWEAHNEDFQKSRKLYIEKISKEKNLTTDEVAQSEDMANFYQHF